MRLLTTDRNVDSGMRLMMNTYQERLYWHIRKIVGTHEDSDDALQETFIKAYRAIAKFKGQSGLYTWLHRIATNEAIALVRKRKKHIATDTSEMTPSMEPAVSSDPGPDADVIESRLLAAVDQLPDKQRQVFQLRYFEEMPYKDISEKLETSVGGLKALFHHAVKKIEKHVLQTVEQ